MPPKGEFSRRPAAGFRVDPSVWPRVATVPSGFRAAWGARRAEAEFAQACDKAGFVMSGPSADLVIFEESLFVRLSEHGFLGLAEGYMAGEWSTPKIVEVLTGLLQAGYHPKPSKEDVGGAYTGLELPAQLVRLFSGDGMSSHGTVFSSGVPTTERVAVKSFVQGAGRGNEPAQHYVDVTTLSEPTVVEREDLPEAQLRAVRMLLDAARVRNNTHLVDDPASGAAVGIAAAHRHATVDLLTADADQASDVRAVLEMANVSDNVSVELIDEPFPNPRNWQSHYDAIVSVEKLERLGERGRRVYARSIDRLLTVGGFAALQTVVAAGEDDTLARDCLELARAYLWPAFSPVPMSELHRLFDRETGLRVIAETHIGSHYVRGLALQRETFEGNEREAAADGFDAVYRRMWVFYLAMAEALFKVGALDAVQLTVTTRNRRGRR